MISLRYLREEIEEERRALVWAGAFLAVQLAAYTAITVLVARGGTIAAAFYGFLPVSLFCAIRTRQLWQSLTTMRATLAREEGRADREPQLRIIR